MTAKAVYVIDGDSFVVKGGGRKYEIRLWGIDAPEYDQPGALQAKQALLQLVQKKKLKMHVVEIDRYGRSVARIWAGHLDISAVMVQSGHAWVHRYYCNKAPCPEWLSLEAQARRDKRGMWSAGSPVEPWRWKRRNKGRRR